MPREYSAAELADELRKAVNALRRNRQGYANILEFRQLTANVWGTRNGYGGRYGALTREEIEAVIAEIDPIVAAYDAQHPEGK